MKHGVSSSKGGEKELEAWIGGLVASDGGADSVEKKWVMRRRDLGLNSSNDGLDRLMVTPASN